jgi:hypothetical protein
MPKQVDVEAGEPKQATSRAKPLLVTLAAAGVLLVTGAVLAITLPLTLRKSSVPIGTLQRYYIAAEAHAWDYAPSRTNLCFFNRGDGNARLIRTNYTKAAYVQYTDDTFKVRAEPQG